MEYAMLLKRMIWIESEKTFEEFNQFYLNPYWIVRIELAGNFCKPPGEKKFYAPASRTDPGSFMHNQVLAIYLKDEAEPIYVLGSEAGELARYSI